MQRSLDGRELTGTRFWQAGDSQERQTDIQTAREADEDIVMQEVTVRWTGSDRKLAKVSRGILQC